MKVVVDWARNRLHGYPLLKKLIKFGMVGFSAAVISIFVHWLIILQFPKYNLAGKAIGSIIGFFFGFALNKFWTYVDRTTDQEKYLGKYFIVYAVTFVLYLFMNFYFDHYNNLFALAENQSFDFIVIQFSLKREIIHNILSIIVNAVLNFVGTNYLVFKIKHHGIEKEI